MKKMMRRFWNWLKKLYSGSGKPESYRSEPARLVRWNIVR